MRRTRIAAVLTLAVINVFTLAAGIAVAHMLPVRLAAWPGFLAATAGIARSESPVSIKSKRGARS